MNCEICEAEMYCWRPGSDVIDYKPLFEHLGSCSVCARRFAQVSEADQALRQTIRQVPEALTLEHRILAGLAHERSQKLHAPARWKKWASLAIAAMLLLTLSFAVTPYVREAQLKRQVAALLNHPLPAIINSTDQTQLLAWSASTLHGLSELPPELQRVKFRSARALQVERRPAVLLDMKNEQRASLLIVDGVLTRNLAPHSSQSLAGSQSRWSDGQRTYVLLFHGSEHDMQIYMQHMGITA